MKHVHEIRDGVIWGTLLTMFVISFLLLCVLFAKADDATPAPGQYVVTLKFAGAHSGELAYGQQIFVSKEACEKFLEGEKTNPTPEWIESLVELKALFDQNGVYPDGDFTCKPVPGPKDTSI